MSNQHKKLSFRALQQQEEPPFELLLLADPAMEVLEFYLPQSSIFLALIEDELVGVIVLFPLAQGQCEIKNVAVSPTFQGQGIGQFLIKNAIAVATQQGYQSLIIGTANSSVGQLYLYQKMGFELKSIKANFFLENYPEPIFENGLQAKHLLVLEIGLP